MARFFIFLFLLFFLSTGISTQAMALGVSDFVAVADDPISAVYNPAGLADLKNNTLDWEHGFQGRNLEMGWDDIAVYGATGEAGNGAFLIAYGQDQVGPTQYQRVTSLGYSYGWHSRERISVGVGAKLSRQGQYDNSSGTMTEIPDYAQNNFLIDFGLLINPSDKLKLGLAIHNLGRDTSNDLINYQTTLGASYRLGSLVLAGEIYDLLNEGGSAIEGTIYRFGCRFAVTSAFRLHAIMESSDWGYQGQLMSVELITQSMSFNISLHRVESLLLTGDSINAGIGYRW
jgi:hypothetical protein